MRATLICVLLALPAGSRAEPLRLSAEAAAGFGQLDLGLQRLARATAAAAALAAGERPRGGPRDWEGLAEAFQAAARAAQRAEGPVLPEVPQPVPPDQLRGCGTRAAAVARAERAVKGLQAAAQRCAESRTWLKERLASVQAAVEAWRALRVALDSLPDGDALSELFPGRWTAQEAPVAAALATSRDALVRQIDRLERNQAELRARAGAQAAALAEAARGRDCALAGQWAGASSHGGTVSGMTLELAPAASGWTGTANLGGLQLPVRAVTVSGASVQITLGQGQALTGTLAVDGRGLGGTWSSPEGPAAFSLRRQ